MEILRYSAFSTTAEGGNPAGVVLDASELSDAQMLAVAKEVGYSETAFLTGRADGRTVVRYFSPLAEVPFCGHATVAAAVAHAELHGPGELVLETRAGEVRVETREAGGVLSASLVSVGTQVAELERGDLLELLAALDWAEEDLDPALPPRVAYAGAWHPVLAAATRERLGRLAYDMERLGGLMAARVWTTVALVWRESESVFHARNPFPPGGVVEDPATGAAAAAFGGYLRESGLVAAPAVLTIHQGADMGRPGVITVGVPAEAGAGVTVTGTAVPLSD